MSVQPPKTPDSTAKTASPAPTAASTAVSPVAPIPPPGPEMIPRAPPMGPVPQMAPMVPGVPPMAPIPQMAPMMNAGGPPLVRRNMPDPWKPQGPGPGVFPGAQGVVPNPSTYQQSAPPRGGQRGGGRKQRRRSFGPHSEDEKDDDPQTVRAYFRFPPGASKVKHTIEMGYGGSSDDEDEYYGGRPHVPGCPNGSGGGGREPIKVVMRVKEPRPARQQHGCVVQ
jgi:hypothetical protein